MQDCFKWIRLVDENEELGSVECILAHGASLTSDAILAVVPILEGENSTSYIFVRNSIM